MMRRPKTQQHFKRRVLGISKLTAGHETAGCNKKNNDGLQDESFHITQYKINQTQDRVLPLLHDAQW